MARGSARYHINEQGKVRTCSATIRECRFTIHGTKRALEAIEADVAAQSSSTTGSLSKAAASGGAPANVNAARLADEDPLTRYLPNERMSRSEVEAIPLESIPDTVPATYDAGVAANRLNSGEMNEYVAAIDFALGDNVEWCTGGGEAEAAYGVEIAGTKMYRRGDWLVIDKNGIITKTPVSAVRAARQQFVEDQAMDLQTAHARANAKNKARNKGIDVSEDDLPSRSKTYAGFAKLAALTRAACKSDVKQATTAEDSSKADIRVYLDDGRESAISWKSYVNDGTPSYVTASNATEMGVKLVLDRSAASERIEFLLGRQKSMLARLVESHDPDDAYKITDCREQIAEYDRQLRLLAADPERYEAEAWARAMSRGKGKGSLDKRTEGKAIIDALKVEGFAPDFGSAKLVGKTYSRNDDPRAAAASENVGKNWARAAGVSEQEAVSAMAEVGWGVAGGDTSARSVGPVAQTVLSREVVDMNPTMEDWRATVADDGVIYMGDSVSVRENMVDGWGLNEYGGMTEKRSKKKQLTGIRQVVQSYDGLGDLWENRLAGGVSLSEANHPAGKGKNKVEVHSHDDLSGKPGFGEGHWLSVNFDVKSRRPKDVQQTTVGTREW